MKTPAESAPSSVTATAAVAPRLSLAAIRAAAERLRGRVRVTPCVAAPGLAAEIGADLRLKRDDLQATGAFKERGACHALLCLTPAQRARGVVAASAGNHALGLARHGPAQGVRVTLVMPRGAARVKIERCRALGAEVVLEGDTFDAAQGAATRLAATSGRVLVHPFDDPAVMAGQGTLGLEALTAVPEAEVFVVPVGGGGLLAGVATVVKALRPRARVVAVEPVHAAKFLPAWTRGQPCTVELQPTLADGLRVATIGSGPLLAARDLVGDVVAVTEEEIAYAMLRLSEELGTPVEGAGAVATAALLAGKVADVRGRCVVAPVCGRNVDPATLERALTLGRAHRDARLVA